MIVRLEPNAGVHCIIAEKITFQSAAAVDTHIRYLNAVKKMLWQKEKEESKP